MCALARWAMKSCSYGGITLSSVPSKYQDGIVFQAGIPDFSSAAFLAPRVDDKELGCGLIEPRLFRSCRALLTPSQSHMEYYASKRKRATYRCSPIAMIRAIKIAATDSVIAKNRPSMPVSNGHVGTAETFWSSICTISSFSIRVSASRESS